jgi:peptidoglycan L-alanyl-D-glutamate endopeptidase CwlK
MNSDLKAIGTQQSDAVSEVSRIRIQSLYPGLRPIAYRVLQDVYGSLKRKMNISEGIRSMDQQLQVYKLGREFQDGKWSVVDSSRIVTNAKPGLSWHCYGLAFDCAFAGNDPYLTSLSESERGICWQTFGRVGKSHGLRWGGDFHLINGVNDKPHLEVSYGLTIEQALELYEQGGVQGVWVYLDKRRGVT